jgi:sirohydrochlorin ferrochelatase
MGQPASPSTGPAPTARLPKTALLLIAHGSRNIQANDDLMHIAQQMRRRGPYPIVEGAFLELAAPTIEQAGSRCVQQGARRVLMLPYFLSAGIHVCQDLADLRQLLAEQYPHVEFLLGEPLGRHPLLLDVIADRARDLDKAAVAGS